MGGGGSGVCGVHGARGGIFGGKCTTALHGFLGIGGNNDNNNNDNNNNNRPPDPVTLINNVPAVAAGQLSSVTLTRYLSSLTAADESLREMEGLILR